MGTVRIIILALLLCFFGCGLMQGLGDEACAESTDSLGIDFSYYEQCSQALSRGVNASCGSEIVGDARAEIALQTHQLAERCIEKFKGDVGRTFRALADPEGVARKEFYTEMRKEKASARQVLLAARQEYAASANSYRAPASLLASVDNTAPLVENPVLKRKREKLHSAQLRYDRLRSLADPSVTQVPTQLMDRARQKARDAQSDLKRLADYAKKLDTAASRSRGCWAMAKGRTRLTYPFDPYNQAANFINAQQFQKELNAEWGVTSNRPSIEVSDGGSAR